MVFDKDSLEILKLSIFYYLPDFQDYDFFIIQQVLYMYSFICSLLT